LAEAGSVKELEEMLLAIASEFHEPIRRRNTVGPREDLGLYVLKLKMPYQGLAAVSSSKTLVALNAASTSARRRQTLAHECAHGLLRDVDRIALKLTREKEDRLCSRFARTALMPTSRVTDYFDVHGFPADLESLHAFCREFSVSLRLGIAGLNEHGHRAGSAVLIAATFRCHEKRPEEYDFRVDAAASHPELFVPRDQRLVSVGLGDLSWWARGARPGLQRSGQERHVLFRARKNGVACWHGPARWTVKVHKAATGHQHPEARSLILALDRSELRPMRSDPTRRPTPLRPLRKLPGQTKLTFSP
jgi:hypothetical protein